MSQTKELVEWYENKIKTFRRKVVFVILIMGILATVIYIVATSIVVDLTSVQIDDDGDRHVLLLFMLYFSLWGFITTIIIFIWFMLRDLIVRREDGNDWWTWDI